MIKIQMPKLSPKIQKDEIDSIPSFVSGIYFLYNKHNDLLYVGKSKNLQSRIADHIKGRTNTSYFSKEISYIRYSPVASLMECEIYETYFINTLNPKYNKEKVYNETEYSYEYIDLNDLPKGKFINFIIKLKKINKSTPVSLSALRILCENNNIPFFDLNDTYIKKALEAENIFLVGRNLMDGDEIRTA